MPGAVTDNESTRPVDSLYEVHVKVNMNKTQINVPAVIQCLLEIPSTDYVRDLTETYNGEIKSVLDSLFRVSFSCRLSITRSFVRPAFRRRSLNDALLDLMWPDGRSIWESLHLVITLPIDFLFAIFL